MSDLIRRSALLKEMERCSISRLPKMTTKELQQVDSNCFGFINDNEKRIYIYFSRTGGTGVSLRFEVYIYEENDLVGKIIVVTSKYEECRRFVVCDKKVEQYADVVRYVIENYRYRDMRWRKMSVELKSWQALCKEKDERIKELEGKFDLIVERLEEQVRQYERRQKEFQSTNATIKLSEKFYSKACSYSNAIKIVKGVINERD